MNLTHTNFSLSVSGIAAAALLATAPLHAIVIVDDNFADGDLAQTGALDTNWWTSSSSAGIEIAPGSLGLVTGTSGRGIHTVFDTQTLVDIGDSLTATYTFTTPATVGGPNGSSFRVGLFDTLGRAGLDANVSASSGTPNPIYGFSGAGTTGLPGYRLEMDVNTGTEDLSFREHDATAATPTGRLLASSGGFTSLGSGPDGVYSFVPNTTYTGSISIELISATEVQITGTLDGVTFTTTDVFDSTSFGLLAFHVNSNQFGSSNSAGDPDNGIDFSNVTIEFTPVPEPGTLALGLLGAGLLVSSRRRGQETNA